LTLTQLAAAAVVVAAVSGGLVWQFAPSLGNSGARSETPVTSQVAMAPRSADSGFDARRDDVVVVGVSLADDQYDAAVADLEQALKQGRGKLDASTIAVVEENLQTIDQAIAQAREALATDPANSYLSGHLVEARRRKLDLLRRATALTDMD
jgi:negative regulator of sigma E activity